MKGETTVRRVQGREYRTWSDFIARATFAEDVETGEVKKIYGGGYITNDLTVRKAIALVFGLESFRKEK